MDHCLPMRLDEAVGRLVFCGSSDNFGVRVNEIFTDSHTKKFNVAIAVEAMRKRSSRGLEEAKSSKDRIRGKCLQPKSPIVVCSLVAEDQSIQKPPIERQLPKVMSM